MIKGIRIFTGLAAVLAMSLAAVAPASAALVGSIDDNDCPGAFGGSFPECRIPADPNDGIEDGTPVIIKFNFDDDGNVTDFEINPLFDVLFGGTIDGSEFSFDFGNDGQTGTGTWSYLQGAGDPEISAYTAKGGRAGFNLFNMVGEDYTDTPFFTPANPNGRPAGLSHLSFYDTDGGQQQVPEPGLLALLGLGLTGLGLRRRRS